MNISAAYVAWGEWISLLLLTHDQDLWIEKKDKNRREINLYTVKMLSSLCQNIYSMRLQYLVSNLALRLLKNNNATLIKMICVTTFHFLN